MTATGCHREKRSDVANRGSHAAVAAICHREKRSDVAISKTERS
jgi:hypothetical protein